MEIQFVLLTTRTLILAIFAEHVAALFIVYRGHSWNLAPFERDIDSKLCIPILGQTIAEDYQFILHPCANVSNLTWRHHWGKTTGSFTQSREPTKDQHESRDATKDLRSEDVTWNKKENDKGLPGFFCAVLPAEISETVQDGAKGNSEEKISCCRVKRIGLSRHSIEDLWSIDFESLPAWLMLKHVEGMPNNRGSWNFVLAVHLSWVYFPLHRASDQQGYLKEYDYYILLYISFRIFSNWHRILNCDVRLCHLPRVVFDRVAIS